MYWVMVGQLVGQTHGILAPVTDVRCAFGPSRVFDLFVGSLRNPAELQGLESLLQHALPLPTPEVAMVGSRSPSRLDITRNNPLTRND